MILLYRVFFLTLLFCLTCNTTVLASNKVGNGGNLVLCEDKAKKMISASLLDFYEGDLKLDSVEKVNFNAEESNKEAEKIVEDQLGKLKIAAPKLSEQYLKRLKQLSSEIEFKDEIALTEISDSHHLFKPSDKSCRVEQLAIRKAQIISGEKRFIINNKLWKKMAPIQKAGLLTHEIIYEHFSKLGEENSIKVRKLNRYLFSVKIESSEFWKLIKELEIPIYP